MPISAPGSNSRGFTLVELMVVITVIALASTAAVLAMPDPKGRVFDEAARFATRAKAARDVAVVEGAPVSLWVTAGGYGFDRRAGGARQRIVFDPTGLADRPLSVRLTRDRATATARIEADGRAHVE
jgi:general secretion pathway protein H